MYKKLLVLSLGAVLAACNSGSSSSRGGGGGSTAEPQLVQGRFIDSPVAGMVYETNSLAPSTTDSNGTFQYRVGEEVRFMLGEQVMAKAQGKNILTLLDVVPGARADHSAGATLDEIYNKYPQILNIARLLQSLDIDRLSSSGSKNGLQIPIEAQRIAGDFGTIDFSAADLYADTASQGYKFICEVLKSRAPSSKKASACDGDIVVSREDAAAEVTETENAVASGQPVNQLPVVSAGRDQIVAETREVALQGSVSDPDAGDSIGSIEWVQSDRDGVALDSPTITVNNPDQLNAGFVAPEVEKDQNFYFTLTVVDSQGGVGSDTVAILVANDNDLNPIADAGASQRVGPGDVVTLDGTQSTDDIDGSNLTFAWTQQEGLRVELNGADTPQPTFTAPSPAENAQLVFQLTVTDSSGQTGSDTVTINIQVSPGLASPEANAGEDQNVESGQVVTLSGSGSDPDDDPLTYQWEQIEAPEGMEVTISNANSAQASFTAPEVEETTTLRFKFTVEDGLGNSDSDETQVTIAPPVVCSLTDPNTYALCLEDPSLSPGDFSPFAPNPLSEQFCPDEHGNAVAANREIDPEACFTEASSGGGGEPSSGFPPNELTAAGCPDEHAAAVAAERGVAPQTCIEEFASGLSAASPFAPNVLSENFCPVEDEAARTGERDIDPETCFNEANSGGGGGEPPAGIPPNEATASGCPTEHESATAEGRAIAPDVCIREFATGLGESDPFAPNFISAQFCPVEHAAAETEGRSVAPDECFAEGANGGTGTSIGFPPNEQSDTGCPNESAAARAEGRDVSGQACFTEFVTGIPAILTGGALAPGSILPL